MTSQQISDEAKQTGDASAVVPIHGFAGNVFLTAAGEVGMVLRIHGREYECLDQENIDRHARHLETSLRPFDQDYTIYQYLLKSDGVTVPRQETYPHPVVEYAVRERLAALAGCSTIEAYLVVLFSRYRRPVTRLERLRHKVRAWLSERATGTTIEAEVYAAQHEMLASVETFVQRMKEHARLEILDKQGMWLFFRRILNPDPELAARPQLKYDFPVSRQLTDSPIAAERDHLIVGRKHLTRILTLKEPPQETQSNMLRQLVESEASCYVVLEWRRQSNTEARKVMKRAKNHVLVTGSIEVIRGVLQAMVSAPVPTNPNADAQKPERDTAALIDEALSAMENRGVTFGLLSLSIVVRELTQGKLEHSISRIQKALGDIGMDVYDETLGLTRQYFACIPGNGRYNRRLLWISSENYADLSFLFLPQPGEAWNDRLQAEYLIPLRTRQNTVYLAHLHYGSSPHAFICGVNDSGKSFTANALITHAQKSGGTTLILDIGGSYREITSRFDGSYLDLNPDALQVKINPFCLPKGLHNYHFLYSFVKVLIESGEYRLTDDDRTDLFERVVSMYEIDSQSRTLGTLYTILLPHMRLHLAQWVRHDYLGRSGKYGHVFDNATDTLTLDRFQCLDFQGMEDVPELGEPLLFYVLHRRRSQVYDRQLAGTYKLMVMDEAWRFFRSQTVRDYVEAALKTWRKHNGAFWLITQNPSDILKAGMAPLLAEAQTKILLPNPGMDAAVYRQLLPSINQTQLDLIPALQPKQEFLYIKPNIAKVLQLNASATEIDLFASTPQRAMEEQSV